MADPTSQPTPQPAFDPYHKWLGIPPRDQPPNHYRLLGLDNFETDVDVISNAADQRMGHVRSMQTGKFSQLSQRVLNEISAARICLLKPASKSAYDATLRAQLAAGGPPLQSSSAANAPAPAELPNPFDFGPAPITPVRKPRPHAKQSSSGPLVLILGAVVVVGIIAGVAVLLMQGGGPGPVADQSTDTSPADTVPTDPGSGNDPASAVVAPPLVDNSANTGPKTDSAVVPPVDSGPVTTPMPPVTEVKPPENDPTAQPGAWQHALRTSETESDPEKQRLLLTEAIKKTVEARDFAASTQVLEAWKKVRPDTAAVASLRVLEMYWQPPPGAEVAAEVAEYALKMLEAKPFPPGSAEFGRLRDIALRAARKSEDNELTTKISLQIVDQQP